MTRRKGAVKTWQAKPDHYIQATGVYSWQSQVRQYPARGQMGLTYFGGETEYGTVDCLLMRDFTGKLIGILNHYPFEAPGLEQPGNVNVWVHPEYQRQGIATRLLYEAERRWTFNPQQQRYSVSGASFINRYLKDRDV